MAITNFDDKPKTAYLERFKPQEGLVYRAFLPDWSRKVELLTHWIDGNEALGTRGTSYLCTKGECCQTLGPAGLQIIIPLWVYTVPENTADGNLYAWSPPRDLYASLIATKTSYQKAGWDVRSYDLQITVVKAGKGTRQNAQLLTMEQAVIWRQDPDTQRICGELFASLDSFYIMADSTTARQVAPGGWASIFQTHGITGGALPAGVAPVPLGPPPGNPYGPAAIQAQQRPMIPQAPQPPAPPVQQYAPQAPVQQYAPQAPVQQYAPQAPQAPQMPPAPQIPQAPQPPVQQYQAPAAPTPPPMPPSPNQQQFAQPAGFQAPPQVPNQPPQAPRMPPPPQQAYAMPQGAPDPGTIPQPQTQAVHMAGDELEALMASDFPPQPSF